MVIDFDDTPACANVYDNFSYGTAELRIDNQCNEPFELDATSCEACDPQLTVAPGAVEGFVIETRTIADGLAEGTVTVQALTWSVGAQSGTIDTNVTYYDNSDACDGWDDQGCAVGHRSEPPWPLLVVLGLPLWWRRQRRHS